MRIALITLAVAALAFIGSIIWIFAQKNTITSIIQEKPTQETLDLKVSSDAATLEILKSQWKTQDRIEALEAKIDALTKNNPDIVTTTSQLTQITATGKTTGTGTITSSLTGTIIPISAKFLTKVIQKMSLTLDKNNGIYGLMVFDASSEYSTYIDAKNGITIIATRTPYSVWVKNCKALDPSIYTINEQKAFSFPSFYVNSPKTDTNVRFVMSIESQTLLITLPKGRWNEFKTLMNKK